MEIVDDQHLVGVDIGGSFSDAISICKGKIKILKVLSTPKDPTEAVKNILDTISEKVDVFLHGTTVATNALLERKGAKTLFLTTEGFTDIIEIGRQNRDDIYSIIPKRPEPLVKDDMRVGVRERILADGSVEKSLEGVEELTLLIFRTRPEAVAIGFLFSFLNPKHELELAQKLEEFNIPISISSEVVPEYREYERFTTTVADAYVKPLISDYITRLEKTVKERNPEAIIAIIKSSGGLAIPKRISKRPVELMVSGLAGGVLAAEFTSRTIQRPNIISLDIGGTSTDVAQITDGKVERQYGLKLGKLPMMIPSVNVETIGAGGGSIAWTSSGLLRVGPQSAGAVPGPAAYGRGGGSATVTDADLLFGILPSTLGGGAIYLDKNLSRTAIEGIAQALSLEIDEAVKGIRRIFHENIAQALRSVSTERGIDPRKYSLLAFGGAGPVHGAELAEIMSIPEVLIPPFPGIWSALGLMTADYRYDRSKGILLPLDEVEIPSIAEEFDRLEEHLIAGVEQDGLNNPIIEKSVDMRFIGQSFELNVPWTANKEKLVNAFFDLHQKEYGFVDRTQPVEIVTIRIAGSIVQPDPKLENLDEKEIPTPIENREIMDIGNVGVYRRDLIGRGTVLEGPLVVDQEDTTVWVPPGWKMTATNTGFLILENQALGRINLNRS